MWAILVLGGGLPVASLPCIGSKGAPSWCSRPRLGEADRPGPGGGSDDAEISESDHDEWQPSPGDMDWQPDDDDDNDAISVWLLLPLYLGAGYFALREIVQIISLLSLRVFKLWVCVSLRSQRCRMLGCLRFSSFRSV